MANLDKSTQEIEDEEKKNIEYGFRSGNVFLIDGTKEMFKNRGDEGSYFIQCLWMFERILRQKLSLNKMDWMGLMIFGIKKSDPDLTSIHTIIKFEAVTKAMLADLKEFTQTDFNTDDWRPSRDYPLSNSLLQAARSFDAVKVGMVTKHINLITCNDNPVQDDDEERHKARVIAKNFKDIHVKIQVVGLGPRFDYGHFYQELMMLAERYPDQDVKKIQLNDLEEGVLRKANVVGNLNLKISDKFKIKVSIQGFSVNRRYATKVWMSKATNEILDKVSFYKQPFEEEEAIEENEEEKDIFDQNIRCVQTFNNTSIIFTPKEVTETKKIIEQGMELLGFKPMDEKYMNLHVTAPLFLGCSVAASKEEKEFFASLIKNCLDKEVMGICVAAIRAASSPGLYSIWPCDEFGGFYLYKIPYKENVRDIRDIADRYRYDDNLPFTEEVLQLMTDIMKKSRIKYDYSLFENPSQVKLRNYIEAIATDEVYDATLFLDTTLPDKEIMRERLETKNLIAKFAEAFPRDEFEAGPRKAVCIDRDHALVLLRRGNLGSQTVTILRGMLKALNLLATGRKADLINRLQEYKNNL